MKKIFASCLLSFSLLLSGCSTNAASQQATPVAANAAEPQSTQLFAMDTVMTLNAYGDDAQTALDAASAEITRLDALLSISSDEGDIKPLNENKTGEVSDDTAALLSRAMEVATSTDGAFDFTIAPIMDAWGFSTQNYRVPSAEELLTLLTKVDYHQVSLSGNTVTLANDAKLDLGGIAKGFTSDRVMQVFADNGVSSGIISLGGNVQALGCKPDGSPWRVAIQDPTNPEENFAILEVTDKAVITSGGYQRYFDQDGVRYHHIIDPQTGYPAHNGLISATIISADGTLADGLSTSLFVMGLDKASAYWQAHRDKFDAVLVTDDGTVYITEGLENVFTLENGSTPEIIR